MNGKNLINDMINTYFTLVTLITVMMFGLGTYFIPDARFGYEAFVGPLLFAACGTLPNLVMYSKKELSVKEVLIRKAIQFVLIEAIVLTIIVWVNGISRKYIDDIIMLAISIFVIYVLAHLFSWLQNYLSAKRMTEELIVFQQNHK